MEQRPISVEGKHTISQSQRRSNQESILQLDATGGGGDGGGGSSGGGGSRGGGINKGNN